MWGRRERRQNAIRSGFSGIYHKAGKAGGTAFSAHSRLYCRREFGYQAAAGVTLPPYLTRREPR
jgi:hypothetical protein